MFDTPTDTMPAVVSLKEHLKRARAARWKGKTKADKSAAATAAALAYWEKLGPKGSEARSEEMKRRAAKRKKNKAKGR